MGGSSLSKDRTIAQLRRKLGLLVEYGYFTDLGAVADALGTKRKTMESWADTGADRATPGLIPRMKYRDVVELFEKPIRENDGSLNVEAVVQGGVLELEQRLMPPSAIAISRLIAAAPRRGLKARTSSELQIGFELSSQMR
jgi:hypothetical protein